MPVFGQQSTIGFIGAGAVGGTLAVALVQFQARSLGMWYTLPYTYCMSRRNLRGGMHLRVRWW